MWPVVHDVFPMWSERFESREPHMYLDVEGLVTTGIGNKIDPIDQAVSLPWQYVGGGIASKDAIRREWQYVKSRKDLAPRGGRAFGEFTTLRLDDDAIDALVEERLALNEQHIKAHFFPAFDAWPAPAQLAALSMAWAMGPARFAEFPKFCAAANVLDFRAAAEECHMGAAVMNASAKLRNEADRAFLLAAARCIEDGTPRDELEIYPEGSGNT
jgi:hypothetical protein